MKKGNSTLKVLVIGVIAIFSFIACHLVNSPTAPLTKEIKKGAQIRLNSKNNSEAPSEGNQVKVTITPSNLLVSAHISITQEVFLIFEILFKTAVSIEGNDVAPLPFSKILKILLRDIISSNAP